MIPALSPHPLRDSYKAFSLISLKPELRFTIKTTRTCPITLEIRDRTYDLIKEYKFSINSNRRVTIELSKEAKFVAIQIGKLFDTWDLPLKTPKVVTYTNDLDITIHECQSITDAQLPAFNVW